MKMKIARCICASMASIAAALLFLGFEASAQDSKTAAQAKTASACKGLDENACKGKTADCLWIVPSKGKQKAYCRLKPSGKKNS